VEPTRAHDEAIWVIAGHLQTAKLLAPCVRSAFYFGSLTYQLYYYPGNANLAPHILLEEAAVEFELVLVDRRSGQHKNPEYLGLNPNGRIPTLVRGELVLFEAAAICLHIADHHPDARLIPPLLSVQRSHFYKWLIFLTNTVQTEYMKFRYPEQHTLGEAGAEGVREVAAQRASRAFEVIEASLGSGPYILGEEYSACDAYLLMLAWWANRLPQPPSSLPRLRACLAATAARPATQRACLAEGLDVVF
jgi:glutathione S-transferase